MEWKGLEADPLPALVVVGWTVTHGRKRARQVFVGGNPQQGSLGPSQGWCQVRRVIMGVRTAMTDRRGGVVEGGGNDGWALRMAKFNA